MSDVRAFKIALTFALAIVGVAAVVALVGVFSLGAGDATERKEVAFSVAGVLAAIAGVLWWTWKKL